MGMLQGVIYATAKIYLTSHLRTKEIILTKLNYLFIYVCTL
jgi:hypothetical protein